MPSPELHAQNSPGARSTQGLVSGQECRAGGREAVRQSVEQLSWGHMPPRYGWRDWGTRLAGTHAKLAMARKVEDGNTVARSGFVCHIRL